MKPLSEQTLYEILEVPDDAPSAEIERAYERVRSIYEPGALATYTLMAPDEAADLGRRIEEARTVLLDPVARAGYDARLASGTPLPRAGRTDDSTPTVSATAPPGFQQPGPRQPPPAAALLEVSIRDLPAATPPPFAAPVPEPAPEAAAPPAGPEAVPAALPAAAVADASAPPPTSPPFAAMGERPPEAAPAAGAAPPPAPRQAEKPVVLPDNLRWSGEQIRKAREARGLTIAQLAERTRITRHHIENVEADRFEKLPAAVYLRGIVMSLARELRLDGQKVARSYLEHLAATKGGGR